MADTILDVFSGDAFGLVSMTEAMNTLPYKPARIGEMGLFEAEPVSTTTVTLEEQGGVLALIPSKPRGSQGTQMRPQPKRNVRSLAVPHIPLDDQVLAADVQNVRKLGTDNELEAVSDRVNAKLEIMRQSHEVTLEFLRIGALKGVVVDGDGTTTLYTLATEFGVNAPAPVDFLLGTDTTKVGDLLIGVKETIEAALQMMPYDHVHAFCSVTWFRKFVEHPEVKYAYQFWQEGSFLRNDPRAGFEYKGVTFEIYRGSIGNIAFIPDGDVRFFPVGVPGLYKTYFAPADFIETVNTLGLPYYAKQEPLPFGKGIQIHTQSNPLPVCTRPACLVRGTSSN